SWRPERAFDDGKKVYIEFPAGIGQGEMPPLFIVGPEGKTSQLVNYRVRGHHMIVDRMFAAAELRLGDGGSEQRVRIVRTDGRLFRSASTSTGRGMTASLPPGSACGPSGHPSCASRAECLWASRQLREYRSRVR